MTKLPNMSEITDFSRPLAEIVAEQERKYKRLEMVFWIAANIAVLALVLSLAV